MLTHRLREAIQNASHLPPDEQDALAAKIESAVKDALWDALLNDPRSDALLQQMIEDAEKEEALPFPTPRDMGDEE